MVRRKQFKAVITDKDFFEDCIWMSYRYCIGRRTIAAAAHANDIARHVHYLSKERRQFMAKDIRSEISSHIHWLPNVTVEGYEYKCDALTLIYKYMMDHPETKEDEKFHFYVNVNTCTVEVEPVEKVKEGYHEKLLNLYVDYIGWIKLANYLDEDNYVNIDVEYEGEKSTLVGFSFPGVYQNEIRLLYTSAENFKNKSSITSYIAPEYIKEIIR